MFFRSLLEGVKIAFVSIWGNKLRSAFTTFCIVIGIVMVTTMVTVIDGINRSFESSMQMLGQNVLFVQKMPWGFDGEYRWWDYANRREMNVEYASEIARQSRLASSVSAEVSRGGSVRFEDRSAQNLEIQGVTFSYLFTSAIEVETGRFFTEDEDHRGRRVIVVGADVADLLFEVRDPMGQHVRLGGQRFEVIGVLEKQGNFLGMESFDNIAIIPIRAYRNTFGLRNNISLRVQFADEETLQQGEYEIEGIMRRVRRLDATADNDFAINKLEMFEQQYQLMTGAIYGVGIFLTALSLFVGGIGVMNIMYVSVKERTKEVGIRKAVGARYREILMQFLIEAVIICIVGGLIGIGISLIIANIINQFFVAHMSITTIVLAFTICLLTGVLFGFLPANKAAKAEPIESLRFS
ncbi:MAG: ABC transporter permease [Balneolales bacterium]